MRSIPLFVYGQGIATYAGRAHPALVDTSDLHWRIVRDKGQPALEIRNNGDVHVRLSDGALWRGKHARLPRDYSCFAAQCA